MYIDTLIVSVIMHTELGGRPLFIGPTRACPILSWWRLRQLPAITTISRFHVYYTSVCITEWLFSTDVSLCQRSRHLK